MSALRGVAATLAFLLELCLLATAAYVGYQSSTDPIARVGLGMGAALAVAVFWGFLLAPRSERRLPLAPRLALEAVLFVVAVVALATVGQPSLAAALLVATVIRFLLGTLTGVDARGL